MNDRDEEQEATLFPKRAGERLRDARVAQGLDLDDLASRTRIPRRHLEAIEEGDYSRMPSSTYAIGFAKAYARAVGMDEVEIAREVRETPDMPTRRIPDYEAFELDDPARAPSRGLMLGAVIAALLILVAAGLWYGTTLFRGDGLVSAPAAAPGFVPEAAPTVAETPAAGQVTLVATDDVWLRIYDSTGGTLLQKTMSKGERYDVPPDAAGPMINVGRPDQLQVLVNGSQVAPLGDGRVAIKDVPIGAAALAARGRPAPAASAAAPVPSPSPTSSTASSRPTIPPAFRTPAATPSPRATARPRAIEPAPLSLPTPESAPPGNASGTP